MNKYQTEINNIGNASYQCMPEQIAIDLIEEVELELVTQINEEPVTTEVLGSWCYQISILLEVYNPVFENDIKLLQKLETVLRDWQKDLEFVEGTLGIKP